MAEIYTNNATSILADSIDDSQLTLEVAVATAFPATGTFRIICGSEIMIVTAVAAEVFTVTRGAEGTTAALHLADAPVTHVITAGALDAIRLADQRINLQGLNSARPAASINGRLYFGTDFPIEHLDSGASWSTFYRDQKLTLPVPGDFTWTHGGGTATNTDMTNGGSLLKVTSTGAGDKISVFVKNTPGTPYTATCVFVPIFTPSSVSYCGMVLYDGTKAVIFGLVHASGVTSLKAVKETNLTTFSADYFNSLGIPINWNPVTLRIVDDSTNRKFYLSNDGVNFLEVFAVSRTDFLTPTKIGVFVGTNAAATTNGSPTITGMEWLSWLQE